MEVASADLLRGQSPTLESPIKTTEVMTAAITLPPKEARFVGDFLTRPMPPHYKHSLHFVLRSFSSLYACLQPRPDRLLLQLLLRSRQKAEVNVDSLGMI